MIGVGIDRLAVGLVVEADVAAGDRDVERAARLGDALDRLDELPHDLRPLRVAEVQAVGGADRHARRRTRRCAPPRRPRASRRGADRDSSSGRCRRSTSRARAVVPLTRTTPAPMPGEHQRVGADHVVVLPVDPALAGDGRRRQQREQARPAARPAGSGVRSSAAHFVEVGRPRGRPVVDRRLVDQRGVRNLGDDLAAIP